MNQLYKWSKRGAVIAAAGMVFQTTGCSVDSQQLALTLFGTILQNLVATFVFSSFNLIP